MDPLAPEVSSGIDAAELHDAPIETSGWFRCTKKTQNPTLPGGDSSPNDAAACLSTTARGLPPPPDPQYKAPDPHSNTPGTRQPEPAPRQAPPAGPSLKTLRPPPQSQLAPGHSSEGSASVPVRASRVPSEGSGSTAARPSAPPSLLENLFRRPLPDSASKPTASFESGSALSSSCATSTNASPPLPLSLSMRDTPSTCQDASSSPGGALEDDTPDDASADNSSTWTSSDGTPVTTFLPPPDVQAPANPPPGPVAAVPGHCPEAPSFPPLLNRAQGDLGTHVTWAPNLPDHTDGLAGSLPAEAYSSSAAGPSYYPPSADDTDPAVIRKSGDQSSCAGAGCLQALDSTSSIAARATAAWSQCANCEQRFCAACRQVGLLELRVTEYPHLSELQTAPVWGAAGSLLSWIWNTVPSIRVCCQCESMLKDPDQFSRQQAHSFEAHKPSPGDPRPTYAQRAIDDHRRVLWMMPGEEHAACKDFLLANGRDRRAFVGHSCWMLAYVHAACTTWTSKDQVDQDLGMFFPGPTSVPVPGAPSRAGSAQQIYQCEQIYCSRLCRRNPDAETIILVVHHLDLVQTQISAGDPGPDATLLHYAKECLCTRLTHVLVANPELTRAVLPRIIYDVRYDTLAPLRSNMIAKMCAQPNQLEGLWQALLLLPFFEWASSTSPVLAAHQRASLKCHYAGLRMRLMCLLPEDAQKDHHRMMASVQALEAAASSTVKTGNPMSSEALDRQNYLRAGAYQGGSIPLAPLLTDPSRWLVRNEALLHADKEEWAYNQPTMQNRAKDRPSPFHCTASMECMSQSFLRLCQVILRDRKDGPLADADHPLACEPVHEYLIHCLITPLAGGGLVRQATTAAAATPCTATTAAATIY
eukprot:gene10627-285_t